MVTNVCGEITILLSPMVGWIATSGGAREAPILSRAVCFQNEIIRARLDSHGLPEFHDAPLVVGIHTHLPRHEVHLPQGSTGIEGVISIIPREVI